MGAHVVWTDLEGRICEGCEETWSAEEVQGQGRAATAHHHMVGAALLGGRRVWRSH